MPDIHKTELPYFLLQQFTVKQLKAKFEEKKRKKTRATND